MSRQAAPCVMVLGTSSGAGKSLIATALCRWYADQGLRVAPFKAQNMSNNARVVALAEGRQGEIGSAQYFQALAARARPDARMNPVLLKPEGETRSQVVVLGRVHPDLAAVPWRDRSALLWPFARDALQALRMEYDVLVIEGAGSPAEINLMSGDFVNTSTARTSGAACLLVTDIDRGGAFAHLYGTHALMDRGVRSQVRGFVLNKFRGDPALLAPGPQQLHALTGVPTLAVMPMIRGHGLPEEDGVFHEETRNECAQRDAKLSIAVLAAPHISNLDEFETLRRLPRVRLTWARDAATVQDADWLILPGSKHTRADLDWLRVSGLAEAVRAHANAGKPLLAICGGLQMLGVSIDDSEGVEGGSPGCSEGMGLLPLRTALGGDKTLRRMEVRFAVLGGVWSALSGLRADAYEIRFGRSWLADEAACGDSCREALSPQMGWQRDNVLAIYVHGLFENEHVLQALFGHVPRTSDDAFDRLARQLDESFAPGTLQGLLRPDERHAS